MLFALSVVAVLVGRPATARALDIAPNDDGHIGAWLVAPPLATAGSPDAKSGLWLPASSQAGFAVESASRGGGGYAGSVGGTLVLTQKSELWVALSGGGNVELRVDGKDAGAYGPVHGNVTAWNAFPVDLNAGEHDIVAAYSRALRGDRLRLRVLDRQNLRVPEGGIWRLHGVRDAEAGRLVRSLARARIEPHFGANGQTFELDVEYPSGVPVLSPRNVEVAVKVTGRTLYRESLGVVPLDHFGVHAFVTRLPALPRASLPPKPVTARFEVRVGADRFALSHAVGETVAQLPARAEALEALLAADPEAPRDARAALERAVLDVADATHSARATRRALSALDALVTALTAHENPLNEPGWAVWAHPAASDGRPERLVIAVPPGFDPDAGQRYPLVVLLHGYRGTPESVMAAFTGGKGRTLDGAFVVAPWAHGDAFYRGPGERAVIDALRWMLDVYPIDPRRVTITGVSMGGTGTAAIALRYPDYFAGAAPLAGYHSYFLHRGVAGRTLSDWERAGVHHLSTSSFAEQARLVPFFVAHGQRDKPLANSRSLVERLRALGYAVHAEWPNTGHDVWTLTYGSRRFKRWLAEQQRPEAPRELVIQADTLRYGRQEWLEILELEHPGHRGKLTATLRDDHRIELAASGVSGFCVHHQPGLFSTPTTLVVDGQELVFTSVDHFGRLGARRLGTSWVQAPCEPEPDKKRAGVEGPVRDAFLEPLVFVYGSGDPRTLRANREVARHFARFSAGTDVAYPVVSDRELPPAVAGGASLWLVGTPSDHRILHAIARDLAFSLEDGKLVARGEPLGGAGTGALFVQPNPLAPTHYVVVTLGTDAAGVWRALSLPRILPDFAVYDANVAPAAGQPILGGAVPIAAGFFDQRWQLPANLTNAGAP